MAYTKGWTCCECFYKISMPEARQLKRAIRQGKV